MDQQVTFSLHLPLASEILSQLSNMIEYDLLSGQSL